MDTTETQVEEIAEAQAEAKIKTVRAPRAKKPKVTAAEKPASVEAEAVAVTEAAKPSAYIYALGRRKTSVARVRLRAEGSGTIKINGKDADAYFTTYELRNTIKNPLKISGQETGVDVTATVTGGGVKGQAEAVRLGISRALVALNPIYRKTLKKLGYLMRDPRKKERKKPGLKRARRAPQWSKR